MTPKIWAITLVKNEADIIEYTLRHMFAQGIDVIMVRDNGSTDKTVDVIRNEKFKKHGAELIIETQKADSPYEQSKNMTDMSREAAGEGATHIIPFDADELWTCNLQRVGDHIKQLPNGIYKISQVFYYSTALDNPNEKNPYKRMTYVTSEAKPWLKVFFSWFPGAIIGGGNHFVWGEKEPPTHSISSIVVRHFPCRSFEQMVDKIIRHGQGMDIQYPDNPSWRDDGPQLNFLYRLYQNSGIESLRSIWNDGHVKSDPSGFKLVKDPKTFGLIQDPAPYTE